MKVKCRYNIRLAEKKGVVVRPWRDVAAFHEMLVTTGRRDGFAVHSTGYYQRAYELFHPTGMCELLAAEFEGRPLAALMVFARGRRAWYVYGGSTDRAHECRTISQWSVLRWARAARGIRPVGRRQRRVDTGRSFEKRRTVRAPPFKRGFGDCSTAAQAVDRIYDPLLYRAYLLRASMFGAS
jgi:lipid II:glycine glycyltransferase (peptidoglycan interpeptide bridge formation enzyme)